MSIARLRAPSSGHGSTPARPRPRGHRHKRAVPRGAGTAALPAPRRGPTSPSPARGEHRGLPSGAALGGCRRSPSPSPSPAASLPLPSPPRSPAGGGPAAGQVLEGDLHGRPAAGREPAPPPERPGLRSAVPPGRGPAGFKGRGRRRAGTCPRPGGTGRLRTGPRAQRCQPGPGTPQQRPARRHLSAGEAALCAPPNGEGWRGLQQCSREPLTRLHGFCTGF